MKGNAIYFLRCSGNIHVQAMQRSLPSSTFFQKYHEEIFQRKYILLLLQQKIVRMSKFELETVENKSGNNLDSLGF